MLLANTETSTKGFSKPKLSESPEVLSESDKELSHQSFKDEILTHSSEYLEEPSGIIQPAIDDCNVDENSESSTSQISQSNDSLMLTDQSQEPLANLDQSYNSCANDDQLSSQSDPDNLSASQSNVSENDLLERLNVLLSATQMDRKSSLDLLRGMSAEKNAVEKEVQVASEKGGVAEAKGQS